MLRKQRTTKPRRRTPDPEAPLADVAIEAQLVAKWAMEPHTAGAKAKLVTEAKTTAEAVTQNAATATAPTAAIVTAPATATTAPKQPATGHAVPE